jgi:hypothetical protein
LWYTCCIGGWCSHPASLVVFTFSYKGEKRMLGKAVH